MPRKIPTPVLIPLDMSLSVKGKLHDTHPDINGEDMFMCLYDGRYICGKFYKDGSSWRFNVGYHSQYFLAPGGQYSRWQQIWKMVAPEPPKVKLPLEKCKLCPGRLISLDTCYGDPEGIRHDPKKSW